MTPTPVGMRCPECARERTKVQRGRSRSSAPVLLPLTSVARDLGARHLNNLAANVIMYVSITLCCLGLAMMLWANSRGWSPSPRKVFWTAAGAVAVLVNITPVGSGDIASYAADGRIASVSESAP